MVMMVEQVQVYFSFSNAIEFLSGGLYQFFYSQGYIFEYLYHKHMGIGILQTL